MKIDTQLVQAGARWNPVLDVPGDGRPGVRRTLEAVVATIEGGGRAFAFSSGQVALHALLQTFEPGSRILVTRDLHPDAWSLLEQAGASNRILTIPVNTSDPASFREELELGVTALIVENPSHLLLHGSDLRALAWEVHRRKGLLIADNTSLTPVLQRPLDFGADVVLHLGARNLAGTTEVQAGFVVSRLSQLIARLERLHGTTAAQLSPFDAWQVLHGLKTLPLRLERQESSASRIADWLSTHPRVRRVHHPLAPDHPGRNALLQQAKGAGTTVSFEILEPVLVPGFLRALRIWKASQGQAGVESLVSIPTAHPQSDSLQALHKALGVGDDLVRLSVGIEDPQDLIDDLDQALSNPSSGFSEVWDYVI